MKEFKAPAVTTANRVDRAPGGFGKIDLHQHPEADPERLTYLSSSQPSMGKVEQGVL